MPMIDFIDFLKQQSNIEDKTKIGNLVDCIYRLPVFNQVVGQVFPMCFDQDGTIHPQIQLLLPSSIVSRASKEKTAFVISAYISWVIKKAPGLELAKALISDKLDLLDEKLEMPGLIKNWKPLILSAISTSDENQAVQSIDFLSFLNTPEEKAKLKNQWNSKKTNSFLAEVARVFNETSFPLDLTTQLLMSEALSAFRKNELQEWFDRVQDHVIKTLFIEHSTSIPRFTLKSEFIAILKECGIWDEMSQKNIGILKINAPLFNAYLMQIVSSVGILFEDLELQYLDAAEGNLEANTSSPNTKLTQILNAAIGNFAISVTEETKKNNEIEQNVDEEAEKINEIKKNLDAECIRYQRYLLKQIHSHRAELNYPPKQTDVPMFDAKTSSNFPTKIISADEKDRRERLAAYEAGHKARTEEDKKELASCLVDYQVNSEETIQITQSQKTKLEAIANPDLECLIQKYNLVQSLREKLYEKNKYPNEQIQNFSDELNKPSNQELLNHNRDSMGMMFLKGLGVLLLGFSFIFSAAKNGTAAFWKPKSEVFADKLHDRIDKQLLPKPTGMRVT